jgi:hypothetical protein
MRLNVKIWAAGEVTFFPRSSWITRPAMEIARFLAGALLSAAVDALCPAPCSRVAPKSFQKATSVPSLVSRIYSLLTAPPSPRVYRPCRVRHRP